MILLCHSPLDHPYLPSLGQHTVSQRIERDPIVFKSSLCIVSQATLNRALALLTLLASKHEARITVTVGASVLLPCPDSHLSSQACLQASEPTLPIRPSQAARASPPRSQGHHHQSQRQRRSQNHIDRQRHLYLRYRLEPSRRNSSVSDNNQLPIPLRLLPSPPA